MTMTPVFATLLATLIFLAPSPGPQGEGALAPDTVIVLADGTTKKVEDLTKGDRVRTWKDAQGVWSTGVVKSVVRNNSRNYWVLRSGDLTLRGGSTLWTALAPARLATLSTVTRSDTVFTAGTKELVPAPVTSVREYPTNLVLYNIDLDSPGFFLASGILVHD